MTERSLARVVQLDDVRIHPNADLLELAQVGGWQVVVKKGEFKAGDLAIFIEIDSWVHHDVAPFLCKGKEPRMYKGVPGEKLRTVRLRKELSQGLILPISILSVKTEDGEYVCPWKEGWDVTERLSIIKWEPNIPAQLAGQMKGYFPTHIVPKTDQERIQNIFRKYENFEVPGWEVTEKLEGSSMTVYVDRRNTMEEPATGVCSRNIDLKEDETNTFWMTEKKYNIIQKLLDYGGSIAVQGEMVGPGIQGNIYNLDEVKFYVYSVYDVEAQKYMPPYEARWLCKVVGLEYVPVIDADFYIPADPRELLVMADGESSLFKTPREGLVFKNSDGESFKAISNKYLEKHGKD